MFMFLETGALDDGEITLSLINKFSAERHLLPCYWFDIIDHTGVKAGRIDLRIGHNESSYYIGNIGYSVYPTHRGRHFAAKACVLLYDLARRHGMDELYITCTPDNAASKRTCELAGGKFVEQCDVPEDSPSYRPDLKAVCRYRVSLTD